MNAFHAAVFAWWLYSFGPLFRAVVTYHLEMGWMQLHDAVGVNCKKGVISDIKEQVSSISHKGCMLDNYCECVI